VTGHERKIRRAEDNIRNLTFLLDTLEERGIPSEWIPKMRADIEETIEYWRKDLAELQSSPAK
jgi:hypothetical protein